MDTPTPAFRSTPRSRSVAVLLALGLAGAIAPPVPAASVGLSSVRAQSFENEDLLFFVPETALATYWEGTCEVRIAGKPAGLSYLEMTGYDPCYFFCL